MPIRGARHVLGPIAAFLLAAGVADCGPDELEPGARWELAADGGWTAPAADGGRSEPAAIGGRAGSAPRRGSADACGDVGWVGASSDQVTSRPRGYGSVQLAVPIDNEITRLQTTLQVPTKPAASGTLFLWPGLQPLPGGRNFAPVGSGVLQPVLTWGATCARGAPNDHSAWWIAGHYVNMSGRARGRRGCLGGAGMTVDVGDELQIALERDDDGRWTQRVHDEQRDAHVDYAIDLREQAQNWAIFHIEIPTHTKPASDVVFTDTVIELAHAAPEACQPSVRGANDYFTAPHASRDGRLCCIERIVLRASGVAATTPDALDTPALTHAF